MLGPHIHNLVVKEKRFWYRLGHPYRELQITYGDQYGYMRAKVREGNPDKYQRKLTQIAAKLVCRHDEGTIEEAKRIEIESTVKTYAHSVSTFSSKLPSQVISLSTTNNTTSGQSGYRLYPPLSLSSISQFLED